MATVKGCHLVGSVPLPNTETVLRQCSEQLPSRLKRLPDGETGSRIYFVLFQRSVFEISPLVLIDFTDNAALIQKSFTPDQIEQGLAPFRDTDIKTGYDTAAIDSFAVFQSLQQEGVIHASTKFQVGLPTAANVIAPLVQYAFQAQLEPIYEAALFRDMRHLQDAIPHDKLSIQIDLAVDTMFWEGVDMYKPWFGGDVKQYMIDYIVRMIGQIDPDVDVGIHNCYGDMDHKHWAEPTSLANVVERGLRLFEASPRLINFFHVPVPKSALGNLDAYLAPLEKLVPKLADHHTELVLGLVHFDDPDAMQAMIDAAAEISGLKEYSVATECGWGRTPPDQLTNIMALSTRFSQPRW